MGNQGSRTETYSQEPQLFHAGASPDEETPLLASSVVNNEFGGRQSDRVFRRSIVSKVPTIEGSGSRSVEPPSAIAGETAEKVEFLEPAEALAPLASGGFITTIDGYKTGARPPSVVKSLPAFPPFRRYARHRSFRLFWLNEFRHWWKSSRLLLRIAGLFTLATTPLFVSKMLQVTPFLSAMSSHKRFKSYSKMVYRAVRIVKKLGRGGPMRWFLQSVQVFTRCLRIVVGGWRWVEASQVRRIEVGAEEVMAFIGNKVSRMLARTFIDVIVAYLIMPFYFFLFLRLDLSEESWHPITLFICLGMLRACSPYAASFQGSRVGRVLTRRFFHASKHRWQPIQSVEFLNLDSDDCNEKDEISQSADLAKLGHLVAKALGKTQKIGIDSMEGQRETLAAEGFRQVGSGSGGYAAYECHRPVLPRNSSRQTDSSMLVLLHVTPYGPSILDVMARYIVMEFEDSVDRRNKWSEYMSQKRFVGPSVVEGYCYNGAFFSPHHFAELKATYDKQLLAYDRACRAMVKPRTGRSPNPPSDLASLKLFLVDGKKPRTRKKKAREYNQLNQEVTRVAKHLKSMMSHNPDKECSAPKGVILYFEGLDCAGKSSTGGLVQQALQQAGYQVDMRQYNRPPTEEQKRKPWMNRFEVPHSSMAVAVNQANGNTEEMMSHCIEHSHKALVWDRGPAGDFVYNPTFRAMSQSERRQHFNKFMMFDRWCYENDILFLKLLFVTNRDSIASTLGKRLAQKKMSRDLQTWHKSSQEGDKGFDGLGQIELHIDPTDFVAFNCYQENLRIFANFALNTNSRQNPWIVVNTGDRYAARRKLLHAFDMMLDRFEHRAEQQEDTPVESPAMDVATMLDRGFSKRMPVQLVVSLAGILILIFYYCQHTTFGTHVTNVVDTFFPAGEGVDGHNTTPDGLK